jgi:hypothetical protein
LRQFTGLAESDERLGGHMLKIIPLAHSSRGR